jgi:hypothetical protein
VAGLERIVGTKGKVCDEERKGVGVGVRVSIEVEKLMKDVRLEGGRFVGSYEVQGRFACCTTTQP